MRKSRTIFNRIVWSLPESEKFSHAPFRSESHEFGTAFTIFAPPIQGSTPMSLMLKQWQNLRLHI